MAQNDLAVGDSMTKSIPTDLDIYLLIGQSNMAGRAEIREEDKSILNRTFLFTGVEGRPWVVASNPINRYSTMRKHMEMQRLSPGYSFARTIEQERPDRQVGLVSDARGGTRIVQWLPGTELFEAAMAKARASLQYGRLKGVIWLQGEGDVDSLRTDMYLGRLEELINAIREEFDDQSIPFVAGQLFDTEARARFNKTLLKLPTYIRNTGVATSEGTSAFDGTHYDSPSQILMGERFAEEMLKLLD